MVSPITVKSYGLLAKTICVCPPLTVKHKNGNSGFGSSIPFEKEGIKFVSTCACMWCTAIKGLSNASDNDLANCAPTNKLPIKPGDCVNAIASTASSLQFAVCSAVSTTGTI